MNIKALMRLRYEAQEWALMFEVEIAGGQDRGTRYVDAMALNLWYSRGFELHGFEIKTNRSDWLRELKTAAKADAAFRYCDRWFILASEGVVKPDEVPEPWGWIEVKNDKLFQRKAAPKNTPEAWPRKLIASMQRRTARVEDEEIDALVRAKMAPLETLLRERLENERKALQRKVEEFDKRVAEVATATGIDLLGWNPGERISKAMRLVTGSRLFTGGGYGGLDSIAASLRAKADEVEALHKELAE